MAQKKCCVEPSSNDFKCHETSPKKVWLWSSSNTCMPWAGVPPGPSPLQHAQPTQPWYGWQQPSHDVESFPMMVWGSWKHVSMHDKVARALTQLWNPHHCACAICMQHAASTPPMMGGLPWPPWHARLMNHVEASLQALTPSRGCTQAALHAHCQLPLHQVCCLGLISTWLGGMHAGNGLAWAP